MEPRLILAYALILLLALCLTAAWLWYSRHWRGHRRAYRRSEVERRRRRDERRREESAA
jgi:ABC-type Fe3+ transport system permease subunit